MYKEKSSDVYFDNERNIKLFVFRSELNLEYTGFIYKWTNSLNGKMYIGSHIGSTKDSYTGSGKLFKIAYKNNKHKFNREILELIYGNISDILNKEFNYLSKIEDCLLGKTYYNLIKYPFSSKHLKKTISKVSVATKKKISAARTDAVGYNDGIRNYWILKNEYVPNNLIIGFLPRKSKTKAWYNDGINSRKFEIDMHPMGWGRGRLTKSCKDKKRYNNGIRDIYLSTNDIIPNGFVLGGLILKPIKTPSKVWINDGKTETYVKANLKIPEGYRYGRLVRLNIGILKRNKILCNNGIIAKYFNKDDIPDNWVIGGLPRITRKAINVNISQ